MNDLANVDGCRLFQVKTEINLLCTVKKKKAIRIVINSFWTWVLHI